MNADYATINEFINTIRRLAKSGRSGYNNYLVKPLTTWGSASSEDFENLKKRINIDRRRQAPYELPLLFKKAIIRSVAPDMFDLSGTGTLCLDFLKEMKKHREISSSGEAGEFITILSEPFRLFRESEFLKANEIFTDGIKTRDDSDVIRLVMKSRDSGLIKAKEESDRMLEEISGMVQKGDSAFKTASIQYLVKTANPGIPDLHRELQELFTKLSLPRETYNEIMKSAAVVIYHEIIKSVKANSLSRAVSLITRYTVLFRGHPDTPHYMEVDNFEKNLFNIIEQKDLWDSIS